nr:putative RNA-dependent RNA polymerase [buhirugu virus 7]
MKVVISLQQVVRIGVVLRPGPAVVKSVIRGPNCVTTPILTTCWREITTLAYQLAEPAVALPLVTSGALMAYVYHQVAGRVQQHELAIVRIPINLLYVLRIINPYDSTVTVQHQITDDLPMIKDYYGMPITQRHWPTSNVGWWTRRYGLLSAQDQNLIYQYPPVPRSIHNLIPSYDWELESNSPHPDEAAERNAARFNLPLIAHQLGYIPFTISGRPVEASLGYNRIYTYRDAERKMRADVLTERNAIILVDTDYYVDMPALLTTGLPILMYTFVPETLAGQTRGSNYYIDHSNFVQFRAAGGTSWSHQLWDYNHDYLTSPTIRNRIVSYQVHQRQLSVNRRVVILMPKTVAPDMARVEKTPLCRCKFNQGAFCVMKYKDDEQKISISMGDEHVLTLPLQVFYELRGRFRNWKQADILYNVACLEQNAKVLLQNRGYTTEQVNDVISRISVLHAYLREHANTDLYSIEHYTDMLHYRYDNNTCWGTTLKHSQRAALLPLTTTPNIAPVTDADADKTMVFGRVNIVHNKIVPPQVFNHYAHEFIQLTLNGVQNLHPVDLEQVFKNQNGPQQKARRRQWFTMINPEVTSHVASFTKSESYDGIKWPRAITQTATHNMIELSAFTYSLKQNVLKKQKWYGPGKNPVETVQALTDLANTCTKLVEKDYSKFDGTISRWLRENVELALLLAAFEPQYHALLIKNIRSELDAKAKSKNGVKYETDGSRLSGSAITTDGNTIINAFVSYCALRKNYDKHGAWRRMGLYYGDDGVDLYDEDVNYESSARQLGLKVKNQIIEFGQPLCYLGRRYPNIWISMTSYTPLERALSKLHLVNSSSLELTEALANKAMGYKVIDARTPILSWYCDRILSLYEANMRTMTYQQLEDINNPWPQDDLSLIVMDINRIYGDVCTETNRRAIMNWDLKGQPPFTLMTSEPQLNEDKPAAVLGHYLQERPPIQINQKPLDETIKFTIRDVPGDGNCFFHCLTQHELGNGLTPTEMRRVLREYASAYNPNDYPGQVLLEELQENTPVGLEVVALAAHWLGVTIVVRCQERKAIFLCGGKGQQYWIDYKNNHYTAMYLMMRPIHTIPCDLILLLRQKAECKHKSQQDERPERDYNAFYENVDTIFQSQNKTLDVHDTYEGVNPSWKVAKQLKPQNKPARRKLNCHNLGQAIACMLKIKRHLADYLLILCQQRQFYGKRQASMTDWPLDLDMRAHPFMIVRNLASLLHLDLTVRFPTSKYVQMVRYSVEQPDHVIFLNYSEVEKSWFTTDDAPFVYNDKEEPKESKPTNATSGCQANHSKQSSGQTNGRNNNNASPKTVSTSKSSYRQSRPTNGKRTRSIRGDIDRSRCSGRDGSNASTLPSVKPSGNQTTKSGKIIRSMEAKPPPTKNQFRRFRYDKRRSANRLVSNTSADRGGRNNPSVVECSTTHEEPAPQKREPHTQPPHSD